MMRRSKIVTCAFILAASSGAGFGYLAIKLASYLAH